MVATPMKGNLAMSITISHVDKRTFDEAIPLLRIYPSDILTCPKWQMWCYWFDAKLLTKDFKQPKCPSTEDLNQLCNKILCRCIGVCVCVCVHMCVCMHMGVYFLCM